MEQKLMRQRGTFVALARYACPQASRRTRRRQGSSAMLCGARQVSCSRGRGLITAGVTPSSKSSRCAVLRASCSRREEMQRTVVVLASAAKSRLLELRRRLGGNGRRCQH